MEIFAGEMVGRTLKQEGVTCVFGLCGGHVVSMLEGLNKYGIRFVDTHHEQAAVHMADAWARATGTLGVALVTAGPGVANAMPGVVVAHRGRVPILLLAGRSIDEKSQTGDAQELDQLALMSPVTKWAQTCRSASRIPEYVSMGIRQATSARPGVAFLDIPINVVNSKIDEESVPMTAVSAKAKPAGDPKLVKQAVDMLLNAAHPAILAGSGVLLASAAEEINQFAKAASVPVVTWKGARGIVADDSPYAAQLPALPYADVIMVLGTQLDWLTNFGKPPLIQEHTKIIQVDIEGAEVGHNRRCDVGIVGDAKVVLQQMLGVLEGKETPKRENWPPKPNQEEMKAVMDSVGKMPNGAINLIDLCITLRGKLERDAIVVLDGGETALFGTKFIPAFAPLGVMMLGTFGHLGVGVPTALAAKLAYPERQVVLLTGDGAFGLGAMEMSTALRHNIPIHVIVANDSAWGMIQVDFNRWYGKKNGTGTCLENVHYDKMVEGLGGYGESAAKFSELPEALNRVLDAEKPSLLNVAIDSSLSLQRKGGVSLI